MPGIMRSVAYYWWCFLYNVYKTFLFLSRD